MVRGKLDPFNICCPLGWRHLVASPRRFGSNFSTLMNKKLRGQRDEKCQQNIVNRAKEITEIK